MRDLVGDLRDRIEEKTRPHDAINQDLAVAHLSLRILPNISAQEELAVGMRGKLPTSSEVSTWTAELRKNLPQLAGGAVKSQTTLNEQATVDVQRMLKLSDPIKSLPYRPRGGVLLEQNSQTRLQQMVAILVAIKSRTQRDDQQWPTVIITSSGNIGTVAAAVKSVQSSLDVFGCHHAPITIFELYNPDVVVTSYDVLEESHAQAGSSEALESAWFTERLPCLMLMGGYPDAWHGVWPAITRVTADATYFIGSPLRKSCMDILPVLIRCLPDYLQFLKKVEITSYSHASKEYAAILGSTEEGHTADPTGYLNLLSLVVFGSNTWIFERNTVAVDNNTQLLRLEWEPFSLAKGDEERKLQAEIDNIKSVMRAAFQRSRSGPSQEESRQNAVCLAQNFYQEGAVLEQIKLYAEADIYGQSEKTSRRTMKEYRNTEEILKKAEPKSKRVDYLVALIGKALESDKSIVVVSHFPEVSAHIAHRLTPGYGKHRPLILEYYQADNTADSESLMQKFKTQTKSKQQVVLLAQASQLRSGLQIYDCSQVIFTEIWWDAYALRQVITTFLARRLTTRDTKFKIVYNTGSYVEREFWSYGSGIHRFANCTENELARRSGLTSEEIESKTAVGPGFGTGWKTQRKTSADFGVLEGPSFALVAVGSSSL